MVVDMYTTIVLREREREREGGGEGGRGGGRERERLCQYKMYIVHIKVCSQL